MKKTLIICILVLLAGITKAQPGFMNKRTAIAGEFGYFRNFGWNYDKYTVQKYRLSIERVVSRRQSLYTGYQFFRTYFTQSVDVADQTVESIKPIINGNTLFLGYKVYYGGAKLAPMGKYFSMELGYAFIDGFIKNDDSKYLIGEHNAYNIGIAFGRKIILSESLLFDYSIAYTYMPLIYLGDFHSQSMEYKFFRRTRQGYRLDIRIGIGLLAK